MTGHNRRTQIGEQNLQTKKTENKQIKLTQKEAFGRLFSLGTTIVADKLFSVLCNVIGFRNQIKFDVHLAAVQTYLNGYNV